MSSRKVVESIKSVGPHGEVLPVLQFVQKYKPLAAIVSKATPDRDNPPARDHAGNRLLSGPDQATMNSIYRGTARRNRDNQITLQLLPDLGLCFDILVSLTMSPKDMFSDNITITSESSDLLPATVMMTMLQELNDYYNKHNELSNFVERMLYRVLRDWGASPTIIIPENAIDDLVNNYNPNVQMTLESFSREFDVVRGTPKPIGTLGVPDYLVDSSLPSTTLPKNAAFARSVQFDLQSFDNYRSTKAPSKHEHSYVSFSKLLNAKIDLQAHDASGAARDVNVDELLFVTDNPALLRIAEVRETAMRNRVATAHSKRAGGKLQASLESVYQDFTKHVREVGVDKRKLNDGEIEQLVFKRRHFANTPIAVLRNNTNLRRTSIGESLVRELDTACFIPASVAGDPTRKLGGYIMLDEDGYPLTTAGNPVDEVVDLANYANGKGNFVSSLQERAKELYSGKDCNSQSAFMTKKFLAQASADILTKDLLDRLKNGYYDNNMQLGYNEDFYWLMMTRILKGNRTTLLWIPEEYLVYFALEYDDFGFGKSMLDDMRNLTSMRIMLMIAGLTTALRNSMGRTKVRVQLDEEEQDSGKTFEEIVDEIVKSRISPIPFGVNNIADISKYVQRACYEFEVTGSSDMPDLQVEFEQFNTNFPMPDENLVEELKNLSIQRLSLTRDAIDQSQGADFAIQAATSNMLTMKRIQRIQRAVEPQVAEYLRKRAMNSEYLINKFRDIVDTNYETFQVEKLKSYFGIEDESIMQSDEFKKLVVEQAVTVFIMNIMTELPSPASTTLETQHEAYTAARNFYEEVVKDIFSDADFDPTFQGEEAGAKINGIREAVVSIFMRRWLAEGNILPELSELVRFDDNGNVATNVLDELEKHLKAVGMSMGLFLQRFRNHSSTMDKLFGQIADSTAESGSTGGGDDGGDSGGGGLFDEPMDFGEDMDEEGDTSDEADEETTEEESSTTTTETGTDADGGSADDAGA